MISLTGYLPGIGSLTSFKYANEWLASSLGTHVIMYLTGQKKSGVEQPVQNFTATPTTQVGTSTFNLHNTLTFQCLLSYYEHIYNSYANY